VQVNQRLACGSAYIAGARMRRFIGISVGRVGRRIEHWVGGWEVDEQTWLEGGV
jgi:hypothetical protein